MVRSRIRGEYEGRNVSSPLALTTFQRQGKRTLRTHVVKLRPAPKISTRELARVRKQMNLSRGLFARYLRINVRTLENWEQGRAKPNAQAALLIRLVQRFPDTVERLAKI